MNKTTHFDPWHDRQTINMEPEQMDSLPNERHRRALASLKAHMTKPQA